MKRPSLIAALLLGFAPLSAAQAQDHPNKDMPGQRILQRIDTNGDGLISKDEMNWAGRMRPWTSVRGLGAGVLPASEGVPMF